MDADKIYRWLTQAELDALLEAARQEGRQEAIEDSPTLSQYRDAIHGAKMLEDEARTAYRRGAEAMREAAAQLFDGIPNVPGLASMPLYAEVIRALPVPEATCKVCGRHDQPHDPCDCAGEDEK